MALKSSYFYLNSEPRRDAYGFTVRPQHLERYKEYANIYKEEEAERSEKWKSFLQQQEDSAKQHFPNQVENSEFVDDQTTSVQETRRENDDSGVSKPEFDVQADSYPEKEVSNIKPPQSREVQTWAEIRSSLNNIDNIMSFRVKERKNMKDEHIVSNQSRLPPIEESTYPSKESEEKNEEEFYDSKIVDDDTTASVEGVASPEPFFPWKEELAFLVRGGVPRDLRGEVWQAFVGIRARRIEIYYQDLLGPESDSRNSQEHDISLSGDVRKVYDKGVEVPEKWRKQIEKDLPRTFPGHPALDENGRDSLRRLLLAYARHNPSVGYCQAMNFFAGLLLLMMPEENAFWTLVGIIDDYFDGYYSQEMIESQVDQLVFEELMRERFPKLVNHLDYLGVQVAWISGPWFLSIFVNTLPWESVLRVWDVLLFEGNRVMLFRTAMALMELYGPAIVTTKDAGDAITLFQSLSGSTFDSSQLVLTACMGFLNVTEDSLQALREKHRPAILAVIEERSKGTRVWKDPKGLASKLYSFKHDSEPLIKATKIEQQSEQKLIDSDISPTKLCSTNLDEFLDDSATDSEVDSLPDLQEQVVWLKVELCKLLEEKRSALLRAEELETALMEIVKQDNRRQLSARVEQLEQEVASLRQALADKKEQENAMLQVLLRVEQEQKITEDARLAAEQDAVAQKYAVNVLQEKYDKAMASLAQMEKRVVMAETMLEATLQYESGQSKVSPTPGPGRPDTSQDNATRKTGLLSFGLGWRDRNKLKSSSASSAGEAKSANNEDTSNTSTQVNGHQE